MNSDVLVAVQLTSFPSLIIAFPPKLGVDPKQASQMVRGVATLPHGTGKTVRVLVLCSPDKEAEAKAAVIAEAEAKAAEKAAEEAELAAKGGYR